MSLLIVVNGETHSTNCQTLAELVIELALTGKRYAIEVDGALISKHRHTEFILHDMQKIEIVHAVGGG
ncbi:sulfur carrier protein ThiS [Aquirhabdus sp.]|uniref:sulfur carrier protein ThiS n=1 Tax=Aquirhabdus sp. TaxID=2824160 RepID=UPI00396C7873